VWDGTANDFNGDFYPEYPITAGAAAWVGPGLTHAFGGKREASHVGETMEDTR